MLLDRIVRLILPRQGHFFDLLEQVAAKIDAAAVLFGELQTATGRAQIESVAARLKPIETEADAVCHNLYEELDRTFVTPIDREDLAALTKTLDDVVDGMEHTAAFAALYRFDGLTDPMRQLVRITAAAAGELTKAVCQLRKFADSEVIRQATHAVHVLENEADLVYRTAIAGLFSNGLPTTDLVRQKDMLMSLETGVDQCKDAMDVIRSVVVKNG
jgi:predicted phosphate transport protein (TIGR00153 family)